MKLRPLVIDAIAQKKIKGIIVYAENNIFTKDQVLAIKSGTGKAPGDLQAHRCNLDFGYKVVYSIERHPGGQYRHLSVSVSEDKKLPSIQAVEMLMEEFGFTGPLSDCEKWLEDISSFRQAINVAELMP